MSMAADVRCTALYFCIENNIPQEKAIALLNELVVDMDGTPDNYSFEDWVAEEYARLQKAAEQPLAPDVCPACRGKKGYRDAFDEWYPCQACDRTGKRR